MNSDRRSCQPRLSGLCAMSRRELIIGESVSATTAEMVTAPTRVKANSVNSAPVNPLWKPIGT